MNINRHLQAILQCHLFPKIATLDSTSEARKDFARLLHVIFHTHPANTCQASHVQPIIQLYAGTLSSADQRLLSIFRLFEKQRKVSIASLVAFRPQQNAMDPRTALDALLELDSARVFRAVMSFPAWIKLDFHGTGNSLEGSDNASVETGVMHKYPARTRTDATFAECSDPGASEVTLEDIRKAHERIRLVI